MKCKQHKFLTLTNPNDRDDLLSNLSLQEQPELLATREIGDYWSEKLPKRHIHVLVEPPVSTASLNYSTKSLRWQALLNKSTHDFDVIVHPKRKPNKWTVNIKHASR
ncbi:unnamed protein product [Rhizophagus irregularis]|nr:unnamed protein product [Rhizophagus irregularis]